MKKAAVGFWILSAVLIVLSCLSFAKGFALKNDYYRSESYPSLNQYAYVGGDAYNYIINGTYFTGYSTIGSAAALGAVVLLCTGTILFARTPKASSPRGCAPAREEQPAPSAYSVTVSCDLPEQNDGGSGGTPAP